MQIILLSGGSGLRLWPLSNGVRSKQFLKLLLAPDGSDESMVQRLVRQINESALAANILVATSANQQDSILSQLGHDTEIVTEPERRDTFPAIALATSYLAKSKKLSPDEVVIVMPCDAYTDNEYFNVIAKMADAVQSNLADLVLMGITPTCPSEKYGYVVPRPDNHSLVLNFTEKPTPSMAEQLITQGACWNGGVFAFKLGYLTAIVDKYLPCDTFEQIRDNYSKLPRISFDYEVAEKSESVGVVYYSGAWKDLGTWNALTNELPHKQIGKAIIAKCHNTTIINELSIPVVCHGVSDAVIVASPDGILISDKIKSESLKDTVAAIENRPMCEERRWGTYKVVDKVEFNDGFCVLTKQLTLNPGCAISYQRHQHRNEVWTFIDGNGLIVLDGVLRPVRRGDVINIPKGQLHALKALTPLTFMEVQTGSHLVEEDIERFPYAWPQ
jgi:mannose-1-phosphate guanylyltransferase